MLRVNIVCLLVFLSFSFTYSQSTVKEVKELGGGFSYMVPSDWTIGKIEGMEYQMVRLKGIGFSPNMNFYQEKNDYSFEKYCKLNIEDMKENVHNFKVLDSGDFITDSKLKGKRFVCSDTQGGQNLMQVYYFIDRKDKLKALLTGSSLFQDKDKYLSIFDMIAKSFKTNK